MPEFRYIVDSSVKDIFMGTLDVNIFPQFHIYRTKTFIKGDIFNNYATITASWLFWSACVIITFDNC